MIISHFINVTTQVLRYEGMLYSAHLSTLVHPNHSQPLPKGCLCGLLVLNGQLPNDGAGSVNQSTPRSKLGKVTEEKHMKPPWCSPPGRIARGSFPLTLCVHNADMANVCFFWGDISPLSLGHFHLAPSTAPSRRIYRPCLSVPSCQLWKSLCAGWAVAQSLELDQLAFRETVSSFAPPISRNTPWTLEKGTQHLLKIGWCCFKFQ